MELLPSLFPSQYGKYDFPTLNVPPFTFQESIEYLENLPDNTLARFIYELKWLKRKDANAGKLLIVDAPFVIFLKHAHTISKDLNFQTKTICPTNSEHEISLDIQMSQVEFTPLLPELLSGFEITFAGHKRELGIKTVNEFLDIAARYVKTKDRNSLRVVKLISLFKDYDRYPNEIERDVLNAAHEDYTTLLKLENLYFKMLKPVRTSCPKCNERKPVNERGHFFIDIDSIIDNPFRRIPENSYSIENEILFEQIRKNRGY